MDGDCCRHHHLDTNAQNYHVLNYERLQRAVNMMEYKIMFYNCAIVSSI